MKISPLYFLLAIFFLLAASCDDDDLPTPQDKLDELNERAPITQHGAGTFGCLVNGEVFYNISTTSNQGVGAVLQRFQIDSAYNIKVNITGRTFIGGDRHATTFSFRNPSVGENSNFNIDDIYRILRVREYSMDTTYINSFQLSYFDTNIVAGTFNFRAVNYETADTLLITNGRFDTTIIQ